MPVGATIGAAGLGAVGSIAGGLIQANAASNAANMQQQQYEQTRSDLAPYNTAGQGAVNQLMTALPSLAAPINMDEAALEQTPGYQFTLAQGLKSVQNSAAARGLGTSGAALKGAATYATGLADSTYQQQFANANQNKQNAYNFLTGTSQLGANAAAQSGQIAQQGAAGAASSVTGAGTALSAGLQGAGNALTSGVNTANGLNYANQLLAKYGSLPQSTMSSMYGSLPGVF